MAFKDNPAEFRIIDIALIEPGPAHVRQHFDEASLKGLANSIGRKGLIHPLVVQPADGAGRHALVVGERRRTRSRALSIVFSAGRALCGRSRQAGGYGVSALPGEILRRRLRPARRQQRGIGETERLTHDIPCSTK